MAGNSSSTVYVGNLDERVSDRVLYDILIQAGRVVDLHIPRDKETDKPKGYAFAEYESEEVAEYAVRLFSGLVMLYKKTVKFAISGKDKSSVNLSNANSSAMNSSVGSRPYPVPSNNVELSHQSTRISSSCRFSEQKINNVQAPSDISMHRPNGYRSYYESMDYDYGRRVYGATSDSVSRSRSGRYNMRSSVNYSPY